MALELKLLITKITRSIVNQYNINLFFLTCSLRLVTSFLR